MGFSTGNRWMWLRRELFVLSPVLFAVIMIFQQIFDLCSTLYLTSLPGGEEVNPILAPLWNAPGGTAWLISAKFWMCVVIGLGVPHLAKNRPDMMWAPKLVCFLYWLVVAWNFLLVASTML